MQRNGACPIALIEQRPEENARRVTVPESNFPILRIRVGRRKDQRLETIGQPSEWPVKGNTRDTHCSPYQRGSQGRMLGQIPRLPIEHARISDIQKERYAGVGSPPEDALLGELVVSLGPQVGSLP